MNIFKIIGAIGLLVISFGIINKKRRTQDILYIFGGICLEIYSLYLGDIIFIILQIIFTVSAIYDLVKLERLKKIKTNDQKNIT
jgi:lipid-A-disaccharide synthase-like uncharacterized protein